MKLAEESPREHIRFLRDYLRKKLDLAFEIALETAVNDEARTAIQAAQKQWLEFYEAQRAVASFNAFGGSMAHEASVEEGIYHLRHRIYSLVTPFLQGWPDAPRTGALKKQ